MDLDALTFGAEQIRLLSIDDTQPVSLGAMSAERWQTLIDQLSEIEVIESTKVVVDRVFDTQFLVDQQTTPTN